MRRYRTPLPSMLAGALAQGLNRILALDEAAHQWLKPLHGRSLCLKLQGLEIDLYLLGPTGDDLDRRLRVTLSHDQPVDTTISGSPSALLGMAVPAWRRPGSGVRIEGDVGVAQAIEGLMRRLDPDWEQLLVEALGEVLGHQAWRLLRRSLSGAQHIGQVAEAQLGHFLREESDWLVARDQAQAFSASVDHLREATDRLEAALRRRGLS